MHLHDQPSTAPSTATRARPVSKVLVVIEEYHSLDQMSAGMPYTLAWRSASATPPTTPRSGILAAELRRDRRRRHLRHRRRRPARRPPDPRAVRLRPGDRERAHCRAVRRRHAASLRRGQRRHPLRREAQPLGLLRRRAHRVRPPRPSRRPARNGDPVRSPAQRRHGHPDLCNDAHDCDLSDADAWFRGVMARRSPGRTGRLAVWPWSSPPTRTSTTTRATRC